MHVDAMVIIAYIITPLKTNMEPKYWWFVDVSAFPTGYFQVPCLFFRCICIKHSPCRADISRARFGSLALGGHQRSGCLLHAPRLEMTQMDCTPFCSSEQCQCATKTPTITAKKNKRLRDLPCLKETKDS